jgi:hypothetical protein
MMQDSQPKHILSLDLFIISMILGFFTVLIINSSVLITYIFRYGFEAVTLLQEEASMNTDNFFNNLNSFPATATVVTMLLWAIVGFIVFLITQFIINSAKNIEEDVAISFFYVHPKNFKQSNFWFSVVLQILYILFGTTIIVFWLFLSFKIFIPFSSVVLLIALDSFNTNSLYAAVLILTSLATATFVYSGFFILVRILRSRIF